MKAILVCPEERSDIKALMKGKPPALLPILGKPLLEYWLHHFLDRGVKHVYLLVSDRSSQIRSWIGDGMRWELKVEVIVESHELPPAEARMKYRGSEAAGWLQEPEDVAVMDFMPGMPDSLLFRSYADWFLTVKKWMPLAAAAPDRVGLRTSSAGIWIGWRSQVSSKAELRAPCWIGENAVIGPYAIIGPSAIVENGALVAAHAEVADSIVGPETYVGELTDVKYSLACGQTLINWKNNSCMRVADAFLLSDLTPSMKNGADDSHWLGRLLAAALLLLTLPLALIFVLKAWFHGQMALRLLIAVKPQSTVHAETVDTLIYHELSAAKGWLRRWPQLWKVATGDFAWVGNRPLTPASIATLSNEMEQRWLASPMGLFSLDEVKTRAGPLDQEARLRANINAAKAVRRLDFSILSRIFSLWRQL